MGGFSTLGAIIEIKGLYTAKTVAELASWFNDVDPIVGAVYIEKKPEMTVSFVATIFNHSNLLVEKAASILDNPNLSADKVALILDNPNLSIDKVASICDSPNISSSKLKAILDTGKLTNIDRIATILDGESLTADDAAAHINAGVYTDDQYASTFDSNYLSVDKAALIFDSPNLSADKVANILNNVNLSLTKAQDIVNAMTHKGKPSIGGRIALVKDDFNDNKVVNRDRAGIYDANYVYLFMRPEWNGDISGVSVSEGVVTFTVSNAEIYINYGYNKGTRLHAICYCEDKGDRYVWHIAQFRFIRVNENNFYYTGPGADGANYAKRFGKIVNGSHTELWIYRTTTRNNGTWEVKGDGNGNYEVFLDGESQATVTDTDITENYGVGLASAGDNSDGVKFDNMSIKPL